MADVANHIFLPWVQPGVAANIPDQATENLSADHPAVVSLPVKLVVNSDKVEKTARLYGPGEITGIDPQQVVRVEPRHRTTDFEPNYFPLIEFDRPDFPWLFTPAKADEQGRLRPWLCLVVVRKQQGVEFRPAGTAPLPVLEIKPPARPADELPDLSESHLWSHAQITGADKSQLKTVLESAPARTVSRLLCPRRLYPTTEYIACVVPAFEVGRQAGLNQPTDENKLKPAWLSGSEAPAEITLPVYYSWEFRTGTGGDFEELVRRLEPRELPAEVGKRPIDISHPGFTMQPQPPADAEGTTLGLEGALRVIESKPDPWPDPVRVPFQTALEKILNTPWELATKEGADDDNDPVVGPPIYGCWQAAAHKVAAGAQPPPPATSAPPWLNELNLDPRNRAVAAMGTQVVQEQQEQLMASAWEQLGDIKKINQRLRQAQLSRAVNEKYHVKTFSRFSEEAFVKVVAPAQSRVFLDETPQNHPPNAPPLKTLLAQKLAGSFVPSTAVSAQLRKVTRPRGAVNRKYSKVGVTGVAAMFTMFNNAPTAPPTRGKGAVTIDNVSDKILATIDQQRGFIWIPEPPAHWERIRVGFMEMLGTFRLNSLGSAISSKQPTPPITAEFSEAAKAHHEYLTHVFTTFIFADFRKVISTRDIKATVLISLTPGRAVSQAVLGGAKINSPSLLTGDELDPIMDAPTFPQPMYEALRDLSQDYLFPGLEHVPPNTVQLLQTNAKFIESFLVGLNAEMSRELLWRDYPTDQRGTYFQQFWDTAAAGAQSHPDITPIHRWGARELGKTAVGAGGDKLVLLIRGELLRRYPSTVIYAVQAVKNDDGQREFPTNRKKPTDPPPVESYPIFRGTLEPDVTFVGFDLTHTEIVDGLGWYFVLQQQPTEPRFGLDDDPFGAGELGVIPELKTWNELNWAHLAPSAEKLKELSHVSVNKIQLAPTQPTKGNWGRNSAHMAYITKQLPARVAIHATELIR